jgi:hypothetical protein
VKAAVTAASCYFHRAMSLLSVLELKPIVPIRRIAEMTKSFHYLQKGPGLKLLIKPDLLFR